MTFNPKHVYIGKDIKDIKYDKHQVNKFFKNRNAYNKTIDFYKKYNYNFVPELISSDDKNISIKQKYVGNMLSLKRNIPYNWEKQLNVIRNEFIKNKIIIQDLRFLPYTPLVVNNFTVHNNKIYVVDLTMVLECSTDYINYINYKFNNLIFQINLYLFLLKYINYRFLIIPHIFYHILVLILDW